MTYIKECKVATMSKCININRNERGTMDDAIVGYLRNEHNRCDKLYIEAEICVNGDRWDRAEVFFQQFCAALEQHFAMEENVLFVVYEKAIRSGNEATGVLRNEHQKIRGIVCMLQDALKRRAKNAFLGHSDTLNIMMQQHNLLEESVLYPMTDHILFEQKHDIIKAMIEISAVI